MNNPHPAWFKLRKIALFGLCTLAPLTLVAELYIPIVVIAPILFLFLLISPEMDRELKKNLEKHS